MEVSTSQGLSAFEKKVLQPLKEDLLNGIKATLIHASQATKLFRYVKKSKRLRSLDCTGTCVDDTMAKLIAEAIHECTTLHYLALRHTKLSPKGLLHIGQALRSNIGLKTFIIAETVSLWGEMEHSIAHRFGLALSQHSNLSRFEWIGFRLKDDDAASIAASLRWNESLTYLDLSENPISERGVLSLCRGIKENTTLKHLVLNKLNFDPQLACQYIAKTSAKYNTSLRGVHLAGNWLPFDSVRSLMAMFNYPCGITFLQLSGCKLTQEAVDLIFDVLNANKNLRKLHLSDNAIASLDQLELDKNSVCSDLRLDGNTFSDAGARHLAAAIRWNRRLTSLDISRCGVGPQSIAELSRALVSNYSLTSLSLQTNDKGNGLDGPGNEVLSRNASAKRMIVAEKERLKREREYFRDSSRPTPLETSLSARAPHSTPQTSTQQMRKFGSVIGLSSRSPSGSQIERIEPALHSEGAKGKDQQIAKASVMLGRMGHMVRTASLANESGFVHPHAPANSASNNKVPPSTSVHVDQLQGLRTKLQLVAVETEPSLAFVWGPHTLDLSGIGLNTMPAASAALRAVMQDDLQLAKIRTALLNRNGLPSFPAIALRPFWALVYLDLSYNEISSLPPEILHLSRLQTLDLHCNKIAELPNMLVGMSSLARLYLQHNRLETLPPLILSSPLLEELRLEGNPVPSPMNIVYSRWTSEAVNLGAVGLTSLPRELFLLPRVTDLRLNDNLLVGVPQEIAQLTTLTALYLANNAISSLPWQIGTLTRLRLLDLRGNPMSRGFTAELLEDAELQKLQKTLLSKREGVSPSYRVKLMLVGEPGTGKTSLARGIRKAWGPPAAPPVSAVGSGRVRKIISDGTNLTSKFVPEAINLRRKKRESMGVVPTSPRNDRDSVTVPLEPSSSGPLESSPQKGKRAGPAISPQASDSNTAASALPPHMRSGPLVAVSEQSLETDRRRGSKPILPLSSDSQESILRQGNKSAPGGLSDSMRNITATELGSNSGSNTNVLETVASATALAVDEGAGVTVFDDVVSEQGDKVVRYSVWDFATQEVHFATNGFFVSRHAVYLILFHLLSPLDQTLKSIEMWLQTVSTVAADSPVLLVGTHSDKKAVTPELLDQIRTTCTERFGGRFKNIQGIVPISNKNRKNLSLLLDTLNDIVSRQKHMGEPLPNVYAFLEDQLRLIAHDLPAPVITIQQFHEAALRCGVDESKLPHALDTLRSLAVLMHFRSTLSHMLSPIENTVVLDPVWLANLVCAVFIRKRLIINGVLQYAHTPEIWNTDRYPMEMHPMYLNMLERLELAYPLAKRIKVEFDMEIYAEIPEAACVVPALLPTIAPTGLELKQCGWNPDGHVLRRVYEFKFLPSGLFSRYIIRVLAVATARHYWRSGFILSSRLSTSAFVVVEGNRIRFSVYGGDSSRLLALLDSTLRGLAKHAYGVEPRMYVVCACSSCASSAEAYLWDAVQLAQKGFEGSVRLQCPTSSLVVDAALLLPDIALAELVAIRVSGPDLQVERKTRIGEGGFSQVYRGTLRGVPVAVKQLDEESVLRDFVYEASLWVRLRHPNLVQLLGVSNTPHLTFVMELCSEGSLTNYLTGAKGEVTWYARRKIALDIATALEYLHSLDPPVIHRDIKSQNCLLLSLDPQTEVMVKLCDFGVCHAGQRATGRVVDNPLWLAVEVLSGNEYTSKADIYSFGIVLWEMVALREPFADFKFKFASELEAEILKGLRPTIPPHCPDVIRELITRCWSHEPVVRPSPGEILTILRNFNPRR